jgi:hypothetical protein
MYQFVLIDRGLIGLAVFYTLIPILVVAVDIFRPLSKFPKRVIFLYLMFVGWGTWLGAHPHVLPNLGALRDDATPFAAEWNKLDSTSRRLIAWNMALSGCLIFWFPGYRCGWLPLTQRNARVAKNKAVAVSALIVLWGIPSLVALALLLRTMLR